MKVAVSVPDPIFNATERLAKERKVSRSHIVAEALQEYVSRHGSEAVTAKLNEVYAEHDSTLDAGMSQAQHATVDNEAW